MAASTVVTTVTVMISTVTVSATHSSVSTSLSAYPCNTAGSPQLRKSRCTLRSFRNTLWRSQSHTQGFPSSRMWVWRLRKVLKDTTLSRLEARSSRARLVRGLKTPSSVCWMRLSSRPRSSRERSMEKMPLGSAVRRLWPRWSCRRELSVEKARVWMEAMALLLRLSLCRESRWRKLSVAERGQAQGEALPQGGDTVPAEVQPLEVLQQGEGPVLNHADAVVAEQQDTEAAQGAEGVRGDEGEAVVGEVQQLCGRGEGHYLIYIITLEAHYLIYCVYLIYFRFGVANEDAGQRGLSMAANRIVRVSGSQQVLHRCKSEGTLDNLRTGVTEGGLAGVRDLLYSGAQLLDHNRTIRKSGDLMMFDTLSPHPSDRNSVFNVASPHGVSSSDLFITSTPTRPSQDHWDNPFFRSKRSYSLSELSILQAQANPTIPSSGFFTGLKAPSPEQFQSREDFRTAWLNHRKLARSCHDLDSLGQNPGWGGNGAQKGDGGMEISLKALLDPPLELNGDRCSI
ncbi:LOW QUALITY PROTEIN: hypothetical protein CRUP_007307 [Coryphaenoides rupestris]|nr:LOW QUALITY PROTEIN: hypothetical protein CRUP_007307 [Coryphaenoides rupestris]